MPGAIALVAAAAYQPAEDAQAPAEQALEAVASPVKVTGIEEKVEESVNLAAAKTLVCVGRGFGAEEELKLAEDFARHVGGEIGCTRPISEGEGSYFRSVRPWPCGQCARGAAPVGRCIVKGG